MKKRIIVLSIMIVMILSISSFGQTLNGITIPDEVTSTMDLYKVANQYPQLILQYDHVIASQNNVYAWNDSDMTIVWTHSSTLKATYTDLQANKFYRLTNTGSATVQTSTVRVYHYYETVSSSEILYTTDVISTAGVTIPVNINRDQLMQTSLGNDILTYTNNTNDFKKVEVYSASTSNITITEPTRYQGTGDITTSKNTYTLAPAERITVYKNSGDTVFLNVLYDNQLNQIEQPSEYVLINQPYDGYNTVDKYIIVMGTYKILADEPSQVDLLFSNTYFSNGNMYSVANDPNLDGYRLVNHKQYDRGTYVEGFFEYELDFKQTFIGTVSITASVSAPGTYQIKSSDVTIKAFIDADLNGQDDDTNEGVPTDINVDDWIENPVNEADYPDDIMGKIRYGFDKLFEIITMPFRFIADSLDSVLDWLAESSTWLKSINTFLSGVMGFVPDEIMSAIIMLITVSVIFAIVKVVRG